MPKALDGVKQVAILKYFLQINKVIDKIAKDIINPFKMFQFKQLNKIKTDEINQK